MALDPATLKARIDWRVCELKLLAAETAVSCARERERPMRDLPPPSRRRNEDDA